MIQEPHRDENKPGQHREALPTTRATAHVVDEGRLGEGGTKPRAIPRATEDDDLYANLPFTD